MTRPSNEPVRLLWTGGWDSTFRFLDLVLRLRRNVEPVYLMDYKRQSAGLEIKAMQRIIFSLGKRHPETVERVLPMRIVEKMHLPEDAEIREAYHEVLRSDYIGPQYYFLACMCRHRSLDGIELGAHKDGRLERLLRGYMAVSSDGDGRLSYRLSPDVPAPAHLQKIFAHCRFPLLDLTKIEMQAISAQSGWRTWMDKTWFCHKPTRRGKPCGRCNPCLYALEEGMGRRLPWAARLRYAVFRPKPIENKLSEDLRCRPT